MMRVIVTGAAGAIGYHLCKYLADKGFYVYAVDNYIRGKKDKLYRKLLSLRNVEEIYADLANYDELFKLPKNVDIVFHLAAYNGTQNFYEVPFDVIWHSTLPTINLLMYYKNSNLRRFIYTGSSESYASTVEVFNWKIPTDENVPLCIKEPKNVRWSYAVSKLHGEVATVAASKQFGIPYTIIRYHNIYGPRMGDKHVIPDFIQRAKNGMYKLYGCHNTRTFLYVKDAVRVTYELALSNKAVNEIFNVGGEEEIKMIDLAKLILEIMGVREKIECYPAPPGSVIRRVPDISKLKKTIDFKPVYSLTEGLKETIKYYLKEDIEW